MSDPSALPSATTLRQAVTALKAQSRALESIARAASSSHPDTNALAKALDALERAGDANLGGLRAHLTTWLADEKATRRSRLSEALRAGCEAEGVEQLLLSKAPLELRLPPVSVRIDLDANTAEIVFSQQVLAVTSADATAILTARRSALRELEGDGWDPTVFHATLRKAWSRAAPSGDWAELVDVLPEVVLLRQTREFRRDPDPKRFTPYSRARFAYDLWRLRRDRALACDGWRLSVAPATGATTKDKKLVFWLEDDRGQGQFHLTLRFIREDAHGAA
jgi:hypothetical protein